MAQVGPNLDNLRPPEKLVLDAIHNGRARGNGQMAADLVEGEDAEDVGGLRRQGRRPERGEVARSRNVRTVVPSVRFVISPSACRVFRPCYDAARQNR